MYSQSITVENKTKLNARPASQFVQAAGKFNSQITIEKNCKNGNLKSILFIANRPSFSHRGLKSRQPGRAFEAITGGNDVARFI
ncbi:HPr family phosphocarrier protein [Fonticella tunisiensis]|uniref:Phosphotransferase system HPr (HPr) family protein n=1 Tax=Fonticella tunisiensis TaxID=1096341 RepID=A0A4R7KU75_9CLOT|nr:HPr family phosphocarrier protein [Fonticella tunisiensis]TDT63613.1 phosphotransferase system HPr (HPr) family protein [Fonticella tunisiensis]